MTNDIIPVSGTCPWCGGARLRIGAAVLGRMGRWCVLCMDCEATSPAGDRQTDAMQRHAQGPEVAQRVAYGRGYADGVARRLATAPGEEATT
jgi:ssDNA-binding Zn-finger/Zn-ribbon topoisomerase 1